MVEQEEEGGGKILILFPTFVVYDVNVCLLSTYLYRVIKVDSK